MAAVGQSWEAVSASALPGIYPALDNAERNVTIAGFPDGVQSYIEEGKKGVAVVKLRSFGHGFHSPLVEPCRPFLEEKFHQVLKGDGGKTKYFVDKFMDPVRFYPEVEALPPNSMLLEVGAKPLLKNFLSEERRSRNCLTLAGTEAPPQHSTFLRAMGELYLAGYALDFCKIYPNVTVPMDSGFEFKFKRDNELSPSCENEVS
jgi:acyl transferase domain-containing protein